MKIVVLGFNLSKEDKELINRMVNNVLNLSADLIDLQSYKFNIKEYQDNDIFLVFGNKAKNLIKNLNLTIVRYCPELEILYPGINEEARLNVYHELLELKELINNINKNIITIDKLPNLTSDEVRQLENKLIQLNIKEWVGINNNNQIIRISQKAQIKKDNEINLTFNELYTIKLLMELLDIKEIQLTLNN